MNKLIKKKSILTGEEYLGCNHKWNVIREEEGITHFMFTTRNVIIYHLICENCGEITIRELPVACRKCNPKIIYTKRKEIIW